MPDFYKELNGQAARDLVTCRDHYVKTGAVSMVQAGRGDWTLDTPAGWEWSQLWRAPDGSRSVGTDATGALYGEDE
jgi:hypothetical protein